MLPRSRRATPDPDIRGKAFTGLTPGRKPPVGHGVGFDDLAPQPDSQHRTGCRRSRRRVAPHGADRNASVRGNDGAASRVGHDTGRDRDTSGCIGSPHHAHVVARFVENLVRTVAHVAHDRRAVPHHRVPGRIVELPGPLARRAELAHECAGRVEYENAQTLAPEDSASQPVEDVQVALGVEAHLAHGAEHLPGLAP